MPTPANFPEVVTATQGSASEFSSVEDVLYFNTTTRHVIVADWSALVLRAYISTNSGATWTHVVDGPALQATAGSPVYQVAAFTCDRANNIIYAVYYSAATQQLAIVPFTATGAGGTFGTVVNSTLGYQAGVTANSAIVQCVVLAQYRAVDTAVWIAFDNGRGAVAPPFQDTFLAHYTVGGAVSAATKISNVSNATSETVLGAMGLDLATGILHVTFYDYVPGGVSSNSNLNHVSVSAAGTISAADVVQHVVNATITTVGATIAINASGLIVLTLESNFPGGPRQLATGTAGSWTITNPSFGVRGTSVGFLWPIFFGGQFYIFYNQYNASEEDFFYVTSTDGLTWGTAIQFASYLATDPLDSNLNEFVPIGLASLVGTIPINSGSPFVGLAYWELASVVTPEGYVSMGPFLVGPGSFTTVG